MNRIVSPAVVSLACLVFVAMGGCDPGGGGAHGHRDAGHAEDGSGPMLPDADGDGIPDSFEGRAANTDTDRDGTPDYLDSDSDGDGIDDSIEGGNPNGMPLDTDHDGTPDFQDLDSDGNGIPDRVEGAADPDGDHQPNSRDLDNDGDLIDDNVEIGPDATMPRDVDRDGTPDYLDTDSDADTISDRDEGVAETDGDGTPDRYDQDSDNDGLSDTMEAGDSDLSTPPVDTDGDHIPDFRDTDSDNDGLSDASELAGGTSPTNADTDGDGVSDLVEVASHTNPIDAADSPRTRGNFVFVEPFMMPPSPPRDTLDFATNIRSADVYFLIDTTGSMQGAINNVQASLSTASSGIIDQIRTMIPDTNFGVGDFKDAGDVYLFRNDTDVTSSAAAAQSGVMGVGLANGGGDTPEGDVPSLYAVASGMGTAGIPARTGCPTGTFGYPCFRSGAVPIVVLITDAPFHNGSPTLAGRGNPPGVPDCVGTCAYGGYLDYNAMLPAVTASHIRVIGVAVNGTAPQADLNAIATDSGAVDGAGAPLVTIAGAGSVSTTVVDQVRTLAMATRFDISTRYIDDATDAVDTFPAFVDHIEANTAGDAMRGCAPRTATDTNGDGFLDTFPGVRAGERVCFDIIVKQNATVMPTAAPQLFDATIQVLGDGFTVLDSRQVFFLVPPMPVPPAGPS